MATGILNGRIVARKLGRSTVQAALGAQSDALLSDIAGYARDARRAHEIARRHAAYVAQAEREAFQSGSQSAMADALAATEYRVRSIAVTETFDAVSEERLRVARDIEQVTGVVLEREWNAEMDACPSCVDLDGTTVGLNETFPGGLEPGSAHPGCRCWLEIREATNRSAA